MEKSPAGGHAVRRALVLASGNPLRGDDGVGRKVAEALQADLGHGGVEKIAIITTQQLTPELALPISEADVVVLVDCSMAIPPGSISVQRIEATPDARNCLTHYVELSSLLALAKELYGTTPHSAYTLAIGGHSLDFVQSLSEPVERCIPEAVATLKRLL